MEESTVFEPASAEEAFKLTWSSSLSNARRYHFRHTDIAFFWEGTRDLPVNERWVGDVESRPEPDVRKTRLYDLIMATSMCMIIGEWQKRLTVWCIFMIIVHVSVGYNLISAS